MAKYLQLYLDTDFIIPIGVGDSGNFSKYIDQEASRRLWLYFSRKSGGGTFESAEINKANFEAGREGFFGNFWQHIEKKDKVPGETFRYIDLLDLSHIITRLRDWANATLFTEAPEIVLNFSTVIPLKARRAIAEYLEEKIGNIRSYSIEVNDLLSSKTAYDHQTMAPSFGDQLLIIQSAGNDILLSVQTWCGDQFMQGDEPVRLKKKGSEFLKEALAKMVVDRYEQHYQMLLPDQKEKEYAYQKQFTESWLSGRRGDEDFWIDRFHYSNNPARSLPPIQIDGRQLNLIEKDAIRTTIADISKFYRENIVNRHLHTILVGDVFREEIFLKDCVSVTSSDGKYTYFNDNAIQEALGRYNVKYSTFKEDLRDLERNFMDKANERARIRTYVHNAEIIGGIREAVTAAVKKMRASVQASTERNADLNASWETHMKKSRFDEASDIIGRMSTSDDLAVSKAESIDVLKRIEHSNSMLIDLQQLTDVQPIIESIRSGEKELRELNAKADELRILPETLAASVRKYKDLYPRYKELKRQFDAEPTLTGRKQIVEEMKGLTMEDMPVTDIEPVTGAISVTSERNGGFLGFGGKTTIKIKVNIDNPLPCRGVLVVSPKVITKIPEGRYGVFTIDVKKGSEGNVININETPQNLNLDKNAKKLYVKFWPHEDDKIPINRFDLRGNDSLTF